MKPATIAKLKEPQNKDDFNKNVDMIIDELSLQTDSRERVKEILASLKTKYEISPALVRKLAKAKAEDKVAKLLEENSEIVNLTAVLN